MNQASKRIFWRTAAFLIVGSVIQYILFHAANLFQFDEPGVVLQYVTYYFDRIWEFLFPALSTLMMLVSSCYCGYKTALANGAVYAATRAFYYIPLGYIMSIGYGYDSLESLLGGLVIALIVCAIAYLESLLSAALSLLPAYMIAKKEARPIADVLRSELPRHDSMDISLAGTAALGIIALVQFLKILASEIADTVEFFAGGSSYTTDEVLYVVFKYFFAIALLTGVYFLLCYLKKRAVDEAQSEADESVTQAKEI